MSVKLNLLPPELAVSKNLSKLLKIIKALGVIGMAAFVVFAIGVGAFFVLGTIKLNNLNSSVASLKKEVTAQQASEQQIVLVKDRLTKISKILNSPDSLPNLVVIEPFLGTLSQSTSINQLTIGSDSIGLSLGIKTNSDLTSFLGALQSSDVFKKVEMTSFSLSPSSGYAIEIKADTK